MLDNALYTILAAASDRPGGSIPQEVREAVLIAFMILMLIASIAMIVIVLMQRVPVITSESFPVRPILTTAETRKRARKARSKRLRSYCSRFFSSARSSALWSAQSHNSSKIDERLRKESLLFYFGA